MRLRHSLIIRRPPSAVFPWIADPALASRWQPDVLGYEVIVARPEVVGTEFRERLGGPDRSTEMRGRVVAFEPERLMAFDVRGRGIRVRSRYSLDPEASGTRLVVDLDVRVLGPLSPLLSPILRPKLAAQLLTELAQLCRLCEAEPEPALPG
jgi:uncharacterized protein YndB with AHSA1/START domain